MSDSLSDENRAGVSRRNFLRASALGGLTVTGWSVLRSESAAASASADFPGRSQHQDGAASRLYNFNGGWLFGGQYVAGSDLPSYQDSDFTPVTLPHVVTPLSWREWDPGTWEKTWIYRRHFDLPGGLSGLRTFVDFTGALTSATPTINDQPLAEHLGGYLPFSCELTEYLRDSGNVLAVKLDSTWQNVPPEGSSAGPISIDYYEPGGLHRDVWLRAVPQIFLADVFALPSGVLGPSPQVSVECTVDAAVVPAAGVRVEAALMDGGQTVSRASAEVSLSQAGQATASLTLGDFGSAHLWDVDDPHLYEVTATLYVGNQAVHDFTRHIGFREAVFDVDGFFLNGNRLKLFGLNRHEIFPYTGMSMPARAHRRDAMILKEQLNCNMVRCSHYPQSPYFLDACDELGLLVWEETPGWQYLGDAAWQAVMLQNVHDMVVRDRNRPSVIIWGVQPNEAPLDPDLYTSSKNLANSLDGSRQTSGSETSQTLVNWVQEVFAFDDYHSSDGNAILLPPVPGVPYLVTEAVSTLDGNPLYRRIDSQPVQAQQARMHAQVHNAAGSDNAYSGVLGWCAFDYGTPQGGDRNYQQIKWCGVADPFRLLKPGAASYQAQVSPAVRPVIEPAFYWDFGTTSPATTLGTTAEIWSNCDTLKAYLDGTLYATLAPDTVDYPYLTGRPFYLDVTGIDGSSLPELRLDGYVGGHLALSRSFSSDTVGDRLEVTVDDNELAADGIDATRVAFRPVDRFGAPRPYVQGDATVTVTGPAAWAGLVSTLETSASPELLPPGGSATVSATLTNGKLELSDNGGCGAVWIRSNRGQPGEITVRVTHPDLGPGQVTIRSVSSAGPSLEPVMADPSHSAAQLDEAGLTLSVPDGAVVTARSATEFASIQPGQAVTSTWLVQASSSATPGPITATAAFLLQGEPAQNQAAVPLYVPYPSLAASFNNTGITDNDNPDPVPNFTGFDGKGSSYSAQGLAAAGLPPGATVQAAGLSFTWPDVPVATPDNTMAEGQIIALSGSGTTLGFLLAANQSPVSGTGSIYYADGTTSAFTLDVGNFYYPAAQQSSSPDYIQVAAVNSENHPTGPTGHIVYVFANTVLVNASKTVEAVQLPSLGDVTGANPAMHIFAMTLGTPQG